MHNAEGWSIFCEKNNVCVPLSDRFQGQASCVGRGPRSLRKVQWIRTHQYGFSSCLCTTSYKAHHPSCYISCSCIHLINRGNYVQTPFTCLFGAKSIHLCHSKNISAGLLNRRQALQHSNLWNLNLYRQKTQLSSCPLGTDYLLTVHCEISCIEFPNTESTLVNKIAE